MSPSDAGPSLEEQCTIIILLHNRQHFIPRLTEYLSDYNGPIYISDSSPEPVPPSSIRAPNARYVHAPGKAYLAKLHDACKASTTPYVFDCPDDDFILKGAIRDSVSILNADLRLACVRGRTIQMSSARGRVYPAEEWARHAKNVIFNKPENGPIRQMLGIMRWAVAMNHVVYRRDILLRFYDILAANPHLRPILFIDRLIRYYATSSGGVAFIPRPMAVRDETRLLHRPAELPADVEINVPYSDLPRRLKEYGDPLAKLMAEALHTDDVATLEAFNQKVFARDFPPSRINSAPPWLESRIPIAFSPDEKREINEVLAAVKRNRSLSDRFTWTYLNVRGQLGRMLGRSQSRQDVYTA